MFEAYTRSLISKGAELSFRYPDKTENRELYKKFNGCKEIRLVPCPVAAAKAKAGVLYPSSNKQYELIDFIYKDTEGHFHAFKATLGRTHTASDNHIRELEAKVGADKLSLCYLVPSDTFQTFQIKPTIKKHDSTRGTVYIVMIPNPND